VIGLSLAGCAGVERQDYPAPWPVLALAASGCPVLSGTYGNHGQGTLEATLASWLIEGSVQAFAPVDRVHLEGPTQGRLDFRLIDQQGRLLAARSWQEGKQYRCADGMLVVDRSAGLTMVGMAMSMQARLARAVDGSLVVESREAGGGVVIVVPYAGSYRTWSRYPAVTPATP
jgi:redox-regulated HSP33 family molecular chaperone